MEFFKIDSTIESCGGKLLKLSHDSQTTKTPMRVNVYLPPGYTEISKLPCILYLSGLTCSPENPSEKAFWQLPASKNNVAMIFPDTSPRGANIEGEDKDWDFGLAAGFYVDAVKEPWSKNYRMYDYILKELLETLAIDFKGLDLNNVSITGHSMGGYGALMFYLRNPGRFVACSAFAPICNPSVVPWGLKCFGNYLGDDKELWYEYDPCHLIKKYDGIDDEILIHVGTKDPFHNKKEHDQLLPQNLIAASKGTILENKITYKLVEDYDHSYYFVSSFVPEHFDFHLKKLKALN